MALSRMKVTLFFTILFFVIYQLLPVDADGQVHQQYRLVWSDEFNQDGRPDEKNWNYEIGLIRNEEDQWYQRENAICKNGKLIIVGRREEKKNPNYDSSIHDWRKNRKLIHYTSSCLVTAGRHQWLYGRFELRARIDISPGMWPAWWTLGVDRYWPANGEIDIMEYYRGRLLANIACAGSEGKTQWFSNTFPVDSLGGIPWASQFHVWRMDWTRDFIALFVDGRLLNKMMLDSLVNKDGSGFHPFRQPHYMLLNLAIGGTNGGDPSGTSFPRQFEIDYVRVYQEK
jgi:beta-glucanase (GH16 family)